MTITPIGGTLRALHTLVLLLTLATGISSLAHAAGEKGWFGFALSVEVEGSFFRRTLRTVKIEKVVPSSPAAVAGLATGDIVIEVQGTLVAGTKANDLKLAMQKSVGETLRLKIKRGTAEPHDVTLTATAKPSGA